MGGMGYFLAALFAARVFAAQRRRPVAEFAPAVSLLKSLKGFDPGMMEAFRTHCRQQYAGEFEMLFGISDPGDPAGVAVRDLAAEFPSVSIRLLVCPERLGSNGKVSTLAQMLPEARHAYILINDSDISVGPRYLARTMDCFAPEAGASREVGLVTALYRGRAHGTLGSRLESMGIAEFAAGVLLSRMIEGGLRYGLGSTLAVSRSALEAAGGLEPLLDQLADDYELGVRIARAGYRVVLGPEVVETAVPAYLWQGFIDHQLRWMRTVRDARPVGYLGLVFTQGLGLALLNVLASGASPLSLWLLGMGFFLRLGLAMTVGAEVLGDHATLPWLWLLPVRDLIGAALWVAGLSGDTVVWRGQRFRLYKGRIHPQ